MAKNKKRNIVLCGNCRSENIYPDPKEGYWHCRDCEWTGRSLDLALKYETIEAYRQK